MLASLASRNIKSSGFRHASVAAQRSLHSYTSIRSTIGTPRNSLFLLSSKTSKNVYPIAASSPAINVQQQRALSLWPFSSSSSPGASEKKPDSDETISSATTNSTTPAEAVNSSTGASESITNAAVNASELTSNVPTSSVEQSISAVQALKDSGITEGHAIIAPIEKLICYVHDLFPALPWWGTIALTVLVVRSILFPFVVRAQKDTITMAKLSPGFEEIKDRMEKAMENQQFDKAQLARQEMKEYWLVKHKFNPIRIVKLPALQMSFFIPFFLAVREMATNNFPGFATGGFGWVTDLTVADPYYILPALSACTTLLVIETGAEMGHNSSANKMKPFFRGLIGIGAIFMTFFPAAVLTYWLTSNSFALFQALLLRNQTIRNLLKIPDRPPPRPPKLNAQGKEIGFIESFKNSAGLSEEGKKRIQKQYEEKYHYGQKQKW